MKLIQHRILKLSFFYNSFSRLGFYNIQTVWMLRNKIPANEWPRYDNNSSDCVSLILELWRIWSTPTLPLIAGLPWYEVLLHDIVPSKHWMEVFNHLLYVKSTVCKKWLILYWIIRWQYLKPFKSIQTIKHRLIKEICNLQIIHLDIICIKRMWTLIAIKGWYANKPNDLI